MTHILITSSALILGILVVRTLFQSKLDPRIQYALWALVAVRLLVPVSLPPWDLSVLTAAAPVEQRVAERVSASPVYLLPVGRTDLSHISQPTQAEPGQKIETGDSFGYAVVDPGARTATRYAFQLTAAKALALAWRVGMVGVGLFFLLSNLLFWRKLSKCRRRWEGQLPLPVRQRVYVVPEGVIPSPCLFGGAIYLTPRATETETTLAHVLRHETTHAKHLDPLWALLRCVCLTVYWFDPLVWVAARCARHDCELACDQSVMADADWESRLAYGQALLALVPVKRGTNPFLSATTMTAGKVQLRRRISRIAQQPKRAVAVVVTAALMMGLFCACTFTGGKTETEKGRLQRGTAYSLTGPELQWFNEVFFGNGETMPTQFANPWILYDDVRDVDLYELFYLEGEEPTDEEIRQHLDMDPDDLPCPAYKLTREGLDALLRKYTGTTLADSKLVGLEQDLGQGQDAWYWAHGDTNYCGRLCFFCGTREETVSGTVVKLYHSAGSFAGGQWYCVTLSEEGKGEQGERNYYFVSNQKCDRPVIPTPLPAGEPEAVLSLTDARECVPRKVALESRPADIFSSSWEDRLDDWNLDGYHVQINRCTDGVIRAAVVWDDGTRDVFLSDLNEEAGLFFYQELFGVSGFFVYHSGQYDAHSWGPVYDYYYFADNGELMLLAHTQAHFSEHMVLDVDGDGTDELVCGQYLYFTRDGKIFEADLAAMMAQRFPELGYWDDFAGGGWDVYGKYCEMMGFSSLPDPERGAFMWKRYLYFDGESILVYKLFPQTVDHMTERADWSAPGSVAAAVKDYFASHLEEQADGTWRHVGTDSPEYAYPIDDWRISYISTCHRTEVEDTAVACWMAYVEYHTPQPKKVVLAGGNYVTEDGWACGGYRWFYFAETQDGYRLLWSDEQDASPDSAAFEENIRRQLSAR